MHNFRESNSVIARVKDISWYAKIYVFSKTNVHFSELNSSELNRSPNYEYMTAHIYLYASESLYMRIYIYMYIYKHTCVKYVYIYVQFTQKTKPKKTEHESAGCVTHINVFIGVKGTEINQWNGSICFIANQIRLPELIIEPKKRIRYNIRLYTNCKFFYGTV